VGRKKAKRKAEAAAAATTTAADAPEGETRRPSTRAGRAPTLTSMVPVRFEPVVLDEVRRQAEADGRTVSAWIRRAVESELRRSAPDVTRDVRAAHQ
jgi:hypothetical protein